MFVTNLVISHYLDCYLNVGVISETMGAAEIWNPNMMNYYVWEGLGSLGDHMHCTKKILDSILDISKYDGEKNWNPGHLL